MGQNFHKIEAVRLEGGDPPPQSGQPDRFFPVFFFITSLIVIETKIRSSKSERKKSSPAACQLATTSVGLGVSQILAIVDEGPEVCTKGRQLEV